MDNIARDDTIVQDYITTQTVLNDQHQEQTVIISTMNAQDTSDHLHIRETDLHDFGYEYHSRQHDLQDLTIWSPIALSHDQIDIIVNRFFIIARKRLSSLNPEYDLRKDEVITRLADHGNHSDDIYHQCLDLIHDNLQLIDNIGLNDATKDDIKILQHDLMNAHDHALDTKSTIVIKSMRDMLGHLVHMHDQLVTLNQDHMTISSDRSTLSRINYHIDQIVSNMH
jgi:hypothetical protein